MNPAQIHLLINHVPLFGVLAGFLLLAYGILRKNDEIKKMSYIVFGVSALITIPTFLTGHPAEEIVEDLPGVSEAIIEQHEEMAEIAAGFIYALGIAGILALFIKLPEKIQKAVPFVLLLLSLGTGGVIAQTAHLGGQIRHSEIREGSTKAGAEKEGEKSKEEGNEVEEKEENEKGEK